ncbi:MAG TPA: cysteine--tRNA ligase [Candidatus Paceibacterota bacterium]|nr:cysteine--tRNA ligase [Candidatus Paceibacterota bacterium]
MPLRFFNTLSREKEEFKPLHPNEVTFYSCGPTVYNYPHIGNYRAYIFADLLKRVLQYNDYNVKHIMNLTDVDDKTIRDSQKVGKSLKEFTEFYTEAFYKDSRALNIIPPQKYTKASDYVTEMVDIIKTLLKKEIAYKSKDGSVYYDIKKFPEYGKLSGVVLAEQKENASGRIKSDEYEKENAQDFALWKAWDENDGDVFWETDLGKGRPGWHIECSAMSMATLGEEIDLHTGGVDNMFPHHENEIAQSQGATGKPFVKYWMHNEWLLIDNKKMAKSFANFHTLSSLTDKRIDPLAYRFWLMMSHYRSQANFVWEALEGSETALKRLFRLYMGLGEDIGNISQEYKNRFMDYLNDDLDTPRALTVVWDLVKDDSVSNADKKATLLDFDRVLGLGFENLKEEEIPAEITAIGEERELARKSKDFKKSDELRDKIKEMGYEIRDEDDGYKINKI